MLINRTIKFYTGIPIHTEIFKTNNIHSEQWKRLVHCHRPWECMLILKKPNDKCKSVRIPAFSFRFLAKEEALLILKRCVNKLPTHTTGPDTEGNRAQGKTKKIKHSYMYVYKHLNKRHDRCDFLAFSHRNFAGYV